jgi:hypothetical protein
MAYIKTIVCLANSRKTGGRCVAGKEWNGKPGAWVRPVSKRDTREISGAEQIYQNGRFPQLLDIVAIPCAAAAALAHQRENHRIGRGGWVKKGALAWSELPRLLDSPEALWVPDHSSHAGLNNRVPAEQALGDSLYLIEVEKVVFKLGVKSSVYSQAKCVVRGCFGFNGIDYCLDVTDPYIEDRLADKPDGDYPLSKPVLCISLGDPWEGYCYKLIAAVLYKKRLL